MRPFLLVLALCIVGASAQCEIDRQDICSGAIGPRKLADNAVKTQAIADEAVTEEKLSPELKALINRELKLAVPTPKFVNTPMEAAKEDCVLGKYLGKGDYCRYATCAAGETMIGGHCKCDSEEYTFEFGPPKRRSLKNDAFEDLDADEVLFSGQLLQAGMKLINGVPSYICECSAGTNVDWEEFLDEPCGEFEICPKITRRRLKSVFPQKGEEGFGPGFDDDDFKAWPTAVCVAPPTIE